MLTPWQREVSRTIPSAPELLTLYQETLGCYRDPDSSDEKKRELCGSRTCPFCWRNRSWGLTNGSVSCFNIWADAAAEVSAGTGTLRGGEVKAAAEQVDGGWMLSDESRASDVEIYLDNDAQRSGRQGQHSTTIGRLCFFFEHRGNHLQSDDNAAGEEEGDWVRWAAVREYVTAGRGNARLVDPATGCDVFTLRKTVRFFPVSSIRSTVHMVHSCVLTGASPCSLVGGAADKKTWQCRKKGSGRYLLNRCFHSFGRGAIA